MALKFLDNEGLLYFWQRLKTTFVKQEEGKGLSTNDYTTADRDKLASLQNYTLPEASENTLGGVKVGAGLAINDGVLSATGGGVADAVEWTNVQNKPDTFPPAQHGHSASEVTGLATVATTGSYSDLDDTPKIPTDNKDLANGAGYQTAQQVESAITEKGYQTSQQVEQAITEKGYQTSAQVEQAITEKGYQTSQQVEAAIVGKGYQTAEDVESAITEKGYQTSAQVESAITKKGYQTEADVERIVGSKGYQTSDDVEAAITEKGYQTEEDVEGTVEEILEDKGYQTSAQVELIVTGKGYQTASDVASAVANANHLKRAIVSSLPSVEEADQNTIYMVPIPEASGNNRYTEWMVVENAWEKTGDSDVILTGYVKEEDLQSISNTEIDNIIAA